MANKGAARGSHSSGRVPVVGDHFAHFKILDAIGAGGMGAVYRVVHLHTGSEMALKVLLGVDDEELELRFQREASSLKELYHPNIVEIGEAGIFNGILYFSMELVKGQSFSTLLETEFRSEEGFPDLEKIVDLFIDVSDALAHCHKHGMVHRDIKPDNIMIEDETDRVVLVDFGLARWIESPLDVESLTKSSDFLGTPHYMSPEQVGVFPERVKITDKTDVWSLGVTLYYALTGTTPFDGENAYKLFAAMVHNDPRRISEFIPDLPKWLEQLISDCLQKDALRRPTMRSFCDRLTEGQQDVERRLLRTKSYWVLMVVALLVALLPLGLYGYFTQTEAISLELKGKSKRYLNRRVVLVRGKASPVGAKVVLNGEITCFVDGNGQFEKEVSLGDGESKIVARLGDGEKTIEKTLTIVVDQEKPAFEWDSELSESQLNFVDKEIRGRLIETNPKDHIVVDGEAVSVEAGGRFIIEVGVPKTVQQLHIRAVDKAGNECNRTFRILGRSAFARLQKRLLGDRQAWSRADRETLDVIIGRVAESLKKDFDFVETKRFACGGKSHWIGIFRHRKTKLDFALLPGGTFRMGRRKEDSPYPKPARGADVFDSSWDRGVITTPVQEVRIPAFLMSRYEVSREIWFRILGKVGDATPQLPMSLVSWNAVKDWLRGVGGGFRLPSESEWEYACRAGTRTRYYWGDRYDRRYALLKVGAQVPPLQVVSHLESGANAFGLVNMLGNVAEWVEDEFQVNYKFHSRTERPARRRSGLAIMHRVVRGFGVSCPAGSSQCAERMKWPPDSLFSDIGFRVAVTLPKE